MGLFDFGVAIVGAAVEVAVVAPVKVAGAVLTGNPMDAPGRLFESIGRAADTVADSPEKLFKDK